MIETISIVILMKNAGPHLDDLVPALAGQTARNAELVVVDSGSSDGSVELLRRLCERHGLPLTLSCIDAADFGHGRTRNLAVSLASGDIVAMLSQDALPMMDTWLADLTGPLEDPGVAGVFGRQVARPGAKMCESLFYGLTYPAQGRRIYGADQSSFSNLNIYFSNVNSAMRKALAVSRPFRDDLVMSEDQYWGRAVLQDGYSIVYEPGAAVHHSHDYSLGRMFKRYFQSGYSLRQMDLRGDVVRGGASTSLTLLRRVAEENPRHLPYAALYQAVQGFAWLCGRHDLLPARLKERTLYN